jgi:hypothetical protein
MSDPGQFEPSAPRASHNLPAVRAVSARLIQYTPPSHSDFRSALPEGEAAEFLVETEAPIPIRALGPQLTVGEVTVTEVETVDATHYRFVCFTPGLLEEGARISLGWSGEAAEEGEEHATTFRFEGYRGEGRPA